jgi:uncharacterized protein YkwD
MRLHQLLRKRIAFVALVAVIGATAASCGFANTSSSGPADPYTAGLYNSLNYDRARHGLPGVVWSPKLANSAGVWADQMARSRTLYHQNLGALINSPAYFGYRTMGENVLVGGGGMSPNQVEGTLMASAPHRANILSGAFNIVGIGYVRGADGRLWVVQDFGAI